MASALGKQIGSGALNDGLALIMNVGRQTLSTLCPNDIEYYMVALELATEAGDTIDYLTFPILPSSISKTLANRNTIKKSMSGVTVLQNSSLALGEIAISGNFGRSFKNLIDLGSGASKLKDASKYSTRSGKYSLFELGSSGKAFGGINFNLGSMFTAVKTGYGVVKMLQAIVDKSVGVDENGKPFKLFFYNMAFGESYQVVVPPNGVRFYQDLNNNMIWCYDLRFTIVAPLDAVVDAKARAWKQLASTAIKGAVDLVGGVVKDAMGAGFSAIEDKIFG